MNKVWLTVSSVLLGLSFIFGNSIRNIFESVVFLFVVHPFDVGDALLVTDPSNAKDGAQYSKVRFLNVLFSTPKKCSWCIPWTSATRCSLRTPVTPTTAPSTARYAPKNILGVSVFVFLDAGDALLVTDHSQRQGRRPVQLGNVNFSKRVLKFSNYFSSIPLHAGDGAQYSKVRSTTINSDGVVRKSGNAPCDVLRLKPSTLLVHLITARPR